MNNGTDRTCVMLSPVPTVQSVVQCVRNAATCVVCQLPVLRRPYFVPCGHGGHEVCLKDWINNKAGVPCR